MHLISHEAGGCITVRLCVFVSQHLSSTAAGTNPLKNWDVESETLCPVLSKQHLKTGGVICLNPSRQAAA